jgi:hypothetical protein
MNSISEKLPVEPVSDPKWLELVSRDVRSLRYGMVEIVVQDSRVIQIGKTERVRLDRG